MNQESGNCDNVSSLIWMEWLNQFGEDLVDHHHQPIDELSLPMELTSTFLHNLNEDCLLEIFSVMDLMDLCSVAETCTRFGHIAGRVIPKQLMFSTSRNGECEIKLGNYRKCWNSSETRPQTLRDIKRIFRNFGSLLSKVLISCSASFDDALIAEYFLLNLIAIHCNTLERFKIQVDRFKGLNIALKPFINKRLQRLALDNVCIDCDKSLLVDGGSLVELRVIWVCDCGAILENDYPKLERFTYIAPYVATAGSIRYPDEETSLETLSSFISRHPALKKLHLSFDCNEKCALVLLQEIWNSCKDLEDLKIYLFDSDITVVSLQPLQTLQQLRCLKLFGVPFHHFELLSGMTGLRELCLQSCRLPIDSNHFSALAQLTKLKLSTCYLPGDLDVIRVITLLKNLKNLDIFDLENQSSQSIFALNEKTFSKIVAIVRDRPDVLTLKCKFNFFNLKKCDESQKVRLLPTD